MCWEQKKKKKRNPNICLDSKSDLPAREVAAVLSNSLQPIFGPQPARLPCAWDSPGKNTGVTCHFFFQGIFPSRGSNPHWQAGSLSLALPGKPRSSPLDYDQAEKECEERGTRLPVQDGEEVGAPVCWDAEIEKVKTDEVREERRGGGKQRKAERNRGRRRKRGPKRGGKKGY